MSYWLKPPDDEVREMLLDITSSWHISDEFIAALLEEYDAEDDKRERDDSLDPIEDDQL